MLLGRQRYKIHCRSTNFVKNCQWRNKGNTEQCTALYIAAVSIVGAISFIRRCSTIPKLVLPKSGSGFGRIWVLKSGQTGFEIVKSGTALENTVVQFNFNQNDLVAHHCSLNVSLPLCRNVDCMPITVALGVVLGPRRGNVWPRRDPSARSFAAIFGACFSRSTVTRLLRPTYQLFARSFNAELTLIVARLNGPLPVKRALMHPAHYPVAPLY